MHGGVQVGHVRVVCRTYTRGLMSPREKKVLLKKGRAPRPHEPAREKKGARRPAALGRRPRICTLPRLSESAGGRLCYL